MRSLLLLFLFILVTITSTYSQTTGKDPVSNNLLKMFESKLSFKKPDSSFTPLAGESGYESATYKAKTVAIIIPAPYEGARKSIQKGEKTNVFGTVTTIFLDSSTIKTYGKEMLWVVSKVLSPDTIQYEHYIMLQGFLRVPNEEYCISLSALYPTSKDSRVLRQKFIMAFLTAKEEE
jgi:hypothetical protein